MKRRLSIFLAVCLTLPLCAPLPASAAAPEAVGYLPGVTAEMTVPAFWTAGMDDPDALLATADEIAALNALALATEGTNMHDLRNLPETFDGVSRSRSLQKGAAADAEYYLGWTYNETGKKLGQRDFDAIVANCADRRATKNMKLRYGIATQRTELLTFPYDGQILDDPVDFDFDYQALVGIRVNEPVAVYTTSADGKFYQVYTSCCSGWVRVEDIAICKDKAEWLSAWDIPADHRLVFYGDKMYTDYSKTAPETSGRLLTMATVLERMDEQEAGKLVINRLPLHNYAVYLPVRGKDGSYAKVPALINAREKVSEDYLPLTGKNLAIMALASLGDAYGWGGSLLNEDCSSLNRSIFLCFGLDLPRNGNWQWPLSMAKQDAAWLTTEEKCAVLDEMPLGTILNFPGHQMMYLGKKDGGYYVVSTVSSIMGPDTGKRQRTRGVQINALDMKRANGQRWIQAVNRIYLPWQYAADGADSPMPELPWYHAGTAFCLKEGLIDTFDGGYYHPDEAATRAVIAEALWRMAGKPEAGADAEGFADVENGVSYERSALWAKEQGIVNGVDGAFRADEVLTRQQLAVMLRRAYAAEETGGEMGLAGYEDAAEIAAWAYDAMGWAVRSGLINGKSGQTLDPQDAVTRAELAVILQRVSEKFAAGETAG
ncbi:MAG: SH3 domain-containing protein [Oscillospiraceae bacterium]|nr:SH3 domain-containing protein [Oscillospiraceae bacterium]